MHGMADDRLTKHIAFGQVKLPGHAGKTWVAAVLSDTHHLHALPLPCCSAGDLPSFGAPCIPSFGWHGF